MLASSQGWGWDVAEGEDVVRFDHGGNDVSLTAGGSNQKVASSSVWQVDYQTGLIYLCGPLANALRLWGSLSWGLPFLGCVLVDYVSGVEIHVVDGDRYLDAIYRLRGEIGILGCHIGHQVLLGNLLLHRRVQTCRPHYRRQRAPSLLTS